MTTMEKVDLKKSLESFRAKAGDFRMLTVPPLRYLMIDGSGDPNTAPQYADAVSTLYPLAYTVKFASKRALDRDYVVPPLEALWWADDMAAFTTARDKTQWEWTVMLMLPEWIEDALVEESIERVRVKKNPPRLAEVRVEILDEGMCVQTLHVGPYDDEGPVLEALHSEILPSRGLVPAGRHHEIYLKDPRTTAPERLQTILRQPVAAA